MSKIANKQAQAPATPADDKQAKKESKTELLKTVYSDVQQLKKDVAADRADAEKSAAGFQNSLANIQSSIQTVRGTLCVDARVVVFLSNNTLRTHRSRTCLCVLSHIAQQQTHCLSKSRTCALV